MVYVTWKDIAWAVIHAMIQEIRRMATMCGINKAH